MQNYGIAVILFALLVKLVCIPLTIKSKKSMLAMSAMNAELQQLQKKYANNRVKLNEEMQKLYEKPRRQPDERLSAQPYPAPHHDGPVLRGSAAAAVHRRPEPRDSYQALAQMIGLDQFAGANYTVQIKIAEKLNAFVGRKPAISRMLLLNCLAERRDHLPAGFPLLRPESG